MLWCSEVERALKLLENCHKPAVDQRRPSTWGPVATPQQLETVQLGVEVQLGMVSLPKPPSPQDAGAPAVEVEAEAAAAQVPLSADESTARDRARDKLIQPAVAGMSHRPGREFHDFGRSVTLFPPARPSLQHHWGCLSSPPHLSTTSWIVDRRFTLCVGGAEVCLRLWPPAVPMPAAAPVPAVPVGGDAGATRALFAPKFCAMNPLLTEFAAPQPAAEQAEPTASEAQLPIPPPPPAEGAVDTFAFKRRIPVKSKCAGFNQKREPCKFYALPGESFCKKDLQAMKAKASEQSSDAEKAEAADSDAGQPAPTLPLAGQPRRRFGRKCQGHNMKGEPCTRYALDDEVFCRKDLELFNAMASAQPSAPPSQGAVAATVSETTELKKRQGAN